MTGAARDYTRELYPFLEGVEQSPGDEADVVEAVRTSTIQKCRDVLALRGQLHVEYREHIAEAGALVARAIEQGGKILAFGNGGSATDAQDVAADCVDPPQSDWRAIPALALVSDVGVLTAVANDVGFEHVFARQIVAFGEPGDVAIAFSTSGNSPSVTQGLVEAKRRRMLTLGLAGYDGGAMARDRGCDFCFVARAEHVPRIQEGQATVWHALLRVIQLELERA